MMPQPGDRALSWKAWIPAWHYTLCIGGRDQAWPYGEKRVFSNRRVRR